MSARASPTGISLALAIAAVAGCASVTQGQTQTVSVRTRYAVRASAVAGAQCTLVNDKGSWQTVTPGVVEVQRSYGDLQVTCRTADGTIGKAPVRSATGGAVFGNVLVGGAVGVGVDVATGAAYNYPVVITVPLCEPKVDASGQRQSGQVSSEAPALDARVPFLNEAQQQRYRDFLRAPQPRAFAISGNGHFASASGAHPQDKSQPSDPARRALATCAKTAGRECDLYVVDADVVYRPCL